MLFLNDTAPTEISTYSHTLSLHDAVPISQGTSCSFLQAVTQALHSMQRSASQRNFILAIATPSVSGRPDLAQGRLGLVHRRHRIIARSEEHTSELQSLMRISYAVFCLKKKNNISMHK